MSESTEREVVINYYDPMWPRLFEQECDRLFDLCSDAIAEVHHVGSTSVPGLAAKPIVDVLVLLRRFLNEAEVAAIASSGYRFVWDEDIQRQYFSRRDQPAFHIHCYLIAECSEGLRMLYFRNYLRAHPDAARDYEALKRRLAAEHRFEREAYQEAKTQFVREIEALTDQERLPSQA
jgi:GrpB-like predicted nucleotidyltransferase (UPF0157 family)